MYSDHKLLVHKMPISMILLRKMNLVFTKYIFYWLLLLLNDFGTLFLFRILFLKTCIRIKFFAEFDKKRNIILCYT